MADKYAAVILEKSKSQFHSVSTVELCASCTSEVAVLDCFRPPVADVVMEEFHYCCLKSMFSELWRHIVLW